MSEIEKIKLELEQLKAELKLKEEKEQRAIEKNRQNSKDHYKNVLKGRPQTDALKRAKHKYYLKCKDKKNAEKLIKD